jgi:hypothetical protein
MRGLKHPGAPAGNLTPMHAKKHGCKPVAGFLFNDTNKHAIDLY